MRTTVNGLSLRLCFLDLLKFISVYFPVPQCPDTCQEQKRERTNSLSLTGWICAAAPESGLTMTSALTASKGVSAARRPSISTFPVAIRIGIICLLGAWGFLFQRYPLSLLVTKCRDRISRKPVLCIVPGSLLRKVTG